VCEGYVQAVNGCFLNIGKSRNRKSTINKNNFFLTIQHFSACMLNIAMSEQVLKQLTGMHELEF
jgi:hypothetical protein